MPKATDLPVHASWLPILTACALGLPLFVDTILHAEYFVSLMLIGLAAALAVRAARGPAIPPITHATIAAAIMVAYLAVRGLAAAEPLVALYGGYSLDGTLFWIAAVVLALFVSSLWSRGTSDTQDGHLTWLLIAVSAYAALSAAAAAVWGFTTVGVPASGLTPNSQYQLQLLTLGLGASAGWAASKRHDRRQVLAAVASLVFLLYGIFDIRSLAAPVAIVVALMYVWSLAYARTRMNPSTFAAIWTGLVGATGALVYSILTLDATTPRAVELFDRLGNGRGVLWSSAARIVETEPLIGRGLAHASSLTRWFIGRGTFDLTTTTDPHNLFFSFATGGGLVAVCLGLAVLFFVQRSIFEEFTQMESARRPVCLAVVGGAVGVFTLSMFAFVYPVAWVLAALLLGAMLPGVVLEGSPAPPTAKSHEGAVRRLIPSQQIALVGALSVLIVSFSAAGWSVFTVRGDALRALSQKGFSSPSSLLETQLGLVRGSWSVLPAGAANDLLSSGLISAPQVAEPFVERVAAATRRVLPNSEWDARLAVTRIRLWAAQEQAGMKPDPRELREAVNAGMEADPASGFWATIAVDLLARSGHESEAVPYARLVVADKSWLRQAEVNADRETYARVMRLAEQ